ncbi:MAG TPA: hypothetical protein VN228_11815 [Pyrinomonadaceae bacterium]|nr:hypothetical protein [Pyrinomonadaceae bacterium]
MRSAAFILALAASAFAVAPSDAAAVYRDAVKGFQSASGEPEVVKLLLNAEGDLPGSLDVSLRRDGGKVTGGSWTLTVLPEGDDPAADERGRLTGAAASGALSFDGEGALSGADAVVLTVESGTGQYARVRGGSATLKLETHAENRSQLTGTLTLDF